eukprot:6029019-Prymnesium_polylepis.1
MRHPTDGRLHVLSEAARACEESEHPRESEKTRRRRAKFSWGPATQEAGICVLHLSCRVSRPRAHLSVARISGVRARAAGLPARDT